MVVMGVVGAMSLAERLRPRYAPACGFGALVLLAAPLAGVGLFGAVALLALQRRLRSRRLRNDAVAHDLVLLGELTALGLSAGLTFVGALHLAADHVHPDLAHEVQRVLRNARQRGAGAVLEAADGRARDLYLSAARASVTGAPVLAAVNAFVADQRAEEQAREMAAARKLPVRLLFPLALLILPGFMVLTVGPTLLGALDRLSF